MSPITIGIIGFVGLLGFLAIGLPIGAGMIIFGFAGLWYLLGFNAALSKLAIIPFETAFTYDFGVLPLFMLMAHTIYASGMSKDLYNLASKWLGNRRGGLAIATTAASAGFAALSASSLATVSTIGLVSMPEMKKYNYAPSLAAGCVAAGGSMGILIPPSGMLIIYGVITETSISKLFIAGIVPGVLEAVLYIAAIYIVCLRNPKLGPPGPSANLKEKIAAFGSCAEIIALVLFVLTGILVGWFTPTEAGAVAAFGAITFSLIRRRLNWQKFKQAVLDTMKTTGMIFFILFGAFTFKYFMAVSRIPFWLADSVGGLSLPPLAIMGLLALVYIVLGAIMDTASMVLLTIPIFFPLAINLGFNPIWFGIFIVIVMEIGMITPPIGINVFVIAGMNRDVPMQTIFKGIIPFLIADLFRMSLLLFIPGLALFLPNLMM